MSEIWVIRWNFTLTRNFGGTLEIRKREYTVYGGANSDFANSQIKRRLPKNFRV